MSNPATGFHPTKHTFFESSFVSIPADRIRFTKAKNFIEEKERIEIDMLTKNRKFINAIMELEIGEL